MGKYSNEELYEIVLEEAKKQHLPEKHVATQCIEDRERTLTLMDIISKTIPQGAVAVDLGAGTGILGFAALNSGADLVYASELWNDYVSFMKIMAEKLGFVDKFDAFLSDAKYFHPPENIDYVIAELVGTGLAVEPLVPAIKNIRKYTKRNSLYFPHTAISTIALMEDDKQLSVPIIYDAVTLPKIKKDKVDTELDLPVQHNGFPTHVEINTMLTYPMGFKTEKFSSLCPSYTTEIGLTREERERLTPLIVKAGSKLRVHIKYLYGDYITVQYRCIK